MKTEDDIHAELDALHDLSLRLDMVEHQQEINTAIQALSWALGDNMVTQPVSLTVQGLITFSGPTLS